MLPHVCREQPLRAVVAALRRAWLALEPEYRAAEEAAAAFSAAQVANKPRLTVKVHVVQNPSLALHCTPFFTPTRLSPDSPSLPSSLPMVPTVQEKIAMQRMRLNLPVAPRHGSVADTVSSASASATQRGSVLGADTSPMLGMLSPRQVTRDYTLLHSFRSF